MIKLNRSAYIAEIKYDYEAWFLDFIKNAFELEEKQHFYYKSLDYGARFTLLLTKQEAKVINTFIREYKMEVGN